MNTSLLYIQHVFAVDTARSCSYASAWRLPPLAAQICGVERARIEADWLGVLCAALLLALGLICSERYHDSLSSCVAYTNFQIILGQCQAT